MTYTLAWTFHRVRLRGYARGASAATTRCGSEGSEEVRGIRSNTAW